MSRLSLRGMTGQRSQNTRPVPSAMRDTATEQAVHNRCSVADGATVASVGRDAPPPVEEIGDC